VYVLPPLRWPQGEALYERALADGAPITDIAAQHETVRLLPVSAADFDFAPVPPADKPPIARFGDALELLALDLPPEVQPGERFPVVAHWRLIRPTRTDYFLRLQPISWANTAEGDPETPWLLRFVYPSPQWSVGEVISTVQRVTLYESAPEGAYQMLVGVYSLPFYRYEAVVSDRKHTETLARAGRSRVPLSGMPQPLPNAVLQGAMFADSLQLESASIDEQGDQIEVRLTWRVLAPTSIDYTVFVHALQGGQLTTQRDFQPFGGRLPISQWQLDEQITLTVTFDRAEFVSGVPIQFSVGLYDPLTLVRASAALEGVPLADDVWALR
jgi:hypothetical protein